MSNKLWKIPSARKMEVIYVSQPEGAGTEKEPVRVVVYIFNKEGRLLARGDEMELEGRR